MNDVIDRAFAAIASGLAPPGAQPPFLDPAGAPASERLTIG